MILHFLHEQAGPQPPAVFSFIFSDFFLFCWRRQMQLTESIQKQLSAFFAAKERERDGLRGWEREGRTHELKM